MLSDQTRRLGRVHWYLAKAAAEQKARYYERLADEPGCDSDGSLFKPSRPLSELGKEIGRDEINWWVFKRESDLHELKRRTSGILQHADVLKTATEKLRINQRKYTRYIDVLATLRDFLDAPGGDISELERYVQWLYDRDHLAPTILFTYRVWGSTRLSNRTCSVAAPSISDEDSVVIDRLAEIALGLWTQDSYTFDHAWRDVSYERYEGQDPEHPTRIHISETNVSPHAVADILTELADYFRCLRDSLRNILIDIDKCESQRGLLSSDSFWRNFILAAAQSPKKESELWDFKKTLAIWQTNGKQKRNAVVRFAEHVVAFANAKGGILIVGVNDDRQIVGLANSSRLESDLKYAREVLVRHARYDNDFVRQVQVPILRPSGDTVTCLVFVVAQTHGVVAVEDEGKYTYPVRAATGLIRRSYGDIATTKLHIMADNFDFVTNDIVQFVDETQRARADCHGACKTGH